MTDNERAVIGNNSGDADVEDDMVSLDPVVIAGGLRIKYRKLFERASEMEESFERFKARTKDGISDDEGLDLASLFLRQVRALSSAMEEARQTEKKPFDEAARVVHSLFKSVTDMAADMISVITTRQTAYLRKKEADERARRQEEADIAAAAAAKAEEEAMATRDAGAIENAIAQAEHAEVVQAAATASTASMSRVRGDYGTTTSLASTRKFRVVDLSKVDPSLLTINDAMVKATDAYKKFKEGDEQPLPGIEVYFEKKARTR